MNTKLFNFIFFVFYKISLNFNFSAFGGKSSLSTRDRLRKTDGFESYDDAIKRTKENRLKIKSGQKRQHDHTGSLSSYNWNSEGCLDKVNENKKY